MIREAISVVEYLVRITDGEPSAKLKPLSLAYYEKIKARAASDLSTQGTYWSQCMY